MLIRTVSDLHLDFHADRGKTLLAEICANPVDVLVVAGDLAEVKNGYTYRQALDQLTSSFPHVVLVSGNHELYRSGWQWVQEFFDHECDRHRNLHVLDGSAVTIGGQRFLGGTLWFRDGPLNKEHQRGMNDFQVIEGFTPRVYQENARQIQFLKESLQKTDIVVSHHLPSMSVVQTQFLGHSLNRFFVCDLHDLISERQPKAWLYGHTHVAQTSWIGATKMVCNPFGYPSEGGTGFDPGKDLSL